MASQLKICSFNCRSIKSSIGEIFRLCESHDIVLLQEHWLLPFELNLLSSIHPDFYGFGTSAVDTSVDVLIGRPYGGTGILYRKHLAHAITVITTDDCRSTAFILKSVIGPVLFVNIYMPTDYGDNDSFDNYIDVCAKVGALFTESDAIFLVVAGDFNCSLGSRFYDSFQHLVSDNHLICSDLTRLTDTYTYCSDNGLNLSWIDHILCSRPIDMLMGAITVLYEYVSSDHKPLSTCFNNLLTQESVPCADINVGTYMQPTWEKADQQQLMHYSNDVDYVLSQVEIPNCLVRCNECACTDTVHRDEIDNYYDKVISCICTAVNNCIPIKHCKTSDFIVPGWTEYVQEKHDLSRQAFIEWVAAGKPRFGLEVTCMRKTRAAFKLALRYCRQHEDQIRADACASSLESKDPRKFWNSIYKVSTDRATKYASTVGGAVGDHDITSMWKLHFEQLYSSVDCNNDKLLFSARIGSSMPTASPVVNMVDIATAIQHQKKGKATGPDGLAMEAFMYGCPRLHAHLAILCTLFFKHQYVPHKFMQSTIIPLVKCKGGDLTDVNNYRAITLSNAVTKIFETVMIEKISSVADSDAYQFGFKKGHSTAQCTSLLKRTVDYYSQRGSHVFVCFIDFKKAFDSVNYWKLFNKLVDDGINTSVVALLAFWYSHQEVCVRWHNTSSDSFYINNGTRQGGILSPFLFTRYIRELLQAIIDTHIGCNIGGIMMNVLAYADDIVLLAPSWAALQALLDVLDININSSDITCNTDKTVCMIFKPACRQKVICNTFPAFMLSGQYLQFVDAFKYLGHIVNHDSTDDNDIKREVRNLYSRINILNRRFSRCSIDVKLMLFKSYCMCLYDAALWTKFNSGTIEKLRACYNKCIKIFFGYPRIHSVTAILSDLGLPSFSSLLGKCQLAFQEQWQCSGNKVVKHFVNLFGYSV